MPFHNPKTLNPNSSTRSFFVKALWQCVCVGECFGKGGGGGGMIAGVSLSCDEVSTRSGLSPQIKTISCSRGREATMPCRYAPPQQGKEHYSSLKDGCPNTVLHIRRRGAPGLCWNPYPRICPHIPLHHYNVTVQPLTFTSR